MHCQACRETNMCSDQAATVAFVYNTGCSKAFSSAAISRKTTTWHMSKWLVLITRLMHVYTRHDQITLCSVHLNSEVGISNHFSLEQTQLALPDS